MNSAAFFSSSASRKSCLNQANGVRNTDRIYFPFLLPTKRFQASRNNNNNNNNNKCLCYTTRKKLMYKRITKEWTVMLTIYQHSSVFAERFRTIDSRLEAVNPVRILVVKDVANFCGCAPITDKRFILSFPRSISKVFPAVSFTELRSFTYFPPSFSVSFNQMP